MKSASTISASRPTPCWAALVPSNRVVQDWGRYLGDNTMSTTIPDRLLHRSTLLELEGKSYRMKDASTRITSAT